jgi:hypothetical protein
MVINESFNLKSTGDDKEDLVNRLKVLSEFMVLVIQEEDPLNAPDLSH